jgi:hypothetical protein
VDPKLGSVLPDGICSSPKVSIWVNFGGFGKENAIYYVIYYFYNWYILWSFGVF